MNVICFLLLFFPSIVFSQVYFEKTYGGAIDEKGFVVIAPSTGGYLVGGNTNTYGSGWDDFYLIRTNATGDAVWTKVYGGTGWDELIDMKETVDGGFILAGYTDSYGAGANDAYLLKVDDQGAFQWDNTYGGTGDDQASSIQCTFDGGYILGGTSVSVSNDFYLVKTDQNGNLDWSKTYGGSGMQFGYAVVQTADSGFAIVGSNWGNVLLIRTDNNGDTIWTSEIASISFQDGLNIDMTTDNGFIVTGRSGLVDEDVLLIRFDSSGDTLWSRTYVDSLSQRGNDVIQTSDGNFLVVGFTHIGGLNYKSYLIKVDTNGDSLWSRTFGGPSIECAISVIEENGGDLVLTGYTNNQGNGGADAYLRKLTSDGIVWISDEKPQPGLYVYPNPTTGKFTVQGATDEIQVYDLFGRLVLRTNKEQIDMSSYPAGIYIVKAGQVVRKLILN